jgi:hypothetical protein
LPQRFGVDDRGADAVALIEGLNAKTYALEGTDDIEVFMEWSFCALDEFRAARILSQNNRKTGLPELEAEAAAREGHVFACLLKMHESARRQYHEAVELALSCSPRVFTCYSWFNEARTFLEEHQQKIQEEEQARFQKEMDKYQKTFEPELRALKAASESGRDALLRLVYSRYIRTATDSPTSTPRKRLLKAIQYLHPDKHADKDKGRLYLLGEVTKYLNAAYETEKGSDDLTL